MLYSDKNNVPISKYTLGTVQLGMNYGISNITGKPDEKTRNEILKTAVEGGVNSFDTAKEYGDSEQVLGSYFYNNETIKNPNIITKFAIDRKDAVNERSIENQIFKKIDDSLINLRLNKIPVVLLHNAEDLMDYGKTAAYAMEKLKSEGKIDRVGVSVYNEYEINEMLKYDVFDVIQVPMNIFDLRLIKSSMLKKLNDRNIFIYVRSIFLQGLFFKRPDDLKGKLKGAADYIRKLNVLSEGEGMSAAQMAVSFIRDTYGVDSLVIGAETKDQVKSNIKLIEGPSIRSTTIDKIYDSFCDVPVQILNPGLWFK